MHGSINLITGTTLTLLLACTSNGGEPTDGTTSIGGDPTTDTMSEPSTSATATAPTTGATDPATSTDGTDTTDSTAASDPTAATDTDPTGEPGPLVEPGDPGPGDVTFKIRADQDRHAISKRIYGSNEAHDLAVAQRGVGLIRQGGNRLTAYNWENNASNAGEDYMNQNDDYLASQLMVDGSIPGEVVRAATQEALDAGADMLVTIPICGHVAADKDGGGDVDQSPNYLETRFHETVAAKGAPFAATPDLGDDKVYQDEFAAWLKGKFPAAFAGDEAQILFSMDNEPDLWNATHPRIHPANVGYVELAQKNRDFARAIKAVVPNAIVTGMVSYGFSGYMTLQAAPDAMGNAIDYYLAQMQAAEQQDGMRLIDVLDLHWYSEIYAAGQRITGEDSSPDSVAARVQAPRSLWDASFHESSWIADDVLQGPVRLIPWLKEKIDAHYPGTGIGFTEYNYGGGGHISGAIAQADTLGIFGREGVALAAYWSLGGPRTFIDAAFRVFTSYDGDGAHFGDTSIQAITSDLAKTSIYASVDAADPGRAVLVAINKTDAPLTAAVTLAAHADYQSVELWQLTGAAPDLASVPGPALADTNAFLLPMPAYSVSVVVPRP